MKINQEKVKSEIKNFLLSDPFYAEVVDKTIGDNDDLLDSGILDSIGILNFLIFLENSYEIKVEIEELNEMNFKNITKIAEFVIKRSATVE